MANIINSPAAFVTPRLRRRLADSAVPMWEKCCIQILLIQESQRACETLIDLLALFLERDEVLHPESALAPLAEAPPLIPPDRATGSGIETEPVGGPERV